MDVLPDRERIVFMRDSQDTTANAVSVEEYLRGCVGFEINDNAISSILLDREINSDTPARDLTRRQKDLCKADLYMWCTSTPSVRGSSEDSDGGWKHKEGGEQSSAYDKRNLRMMANDIYRRYGENRNRSTIKINAQGMRIWQKR